MLVPKSGKRIKLVTLVTLVVGVIMHIWHAAQHWEMMRRISLKDVAYIKTPNDRRGILDVTLPNPTYSSEVGNPLLNRPFALLTNQTRVCRLSQKGHVELFIIIMTRSSERSQRDAIRQTWATYTQNNTSNVRYVFIMATYEPGTVSRHIKTELETYKDIAVYDFKDSYENLTLKTIHGLNYAASYCSVARYVMKTDSDVYVNIPQLIDYLASYKTSDLHALGLLRVNTIPIRGSTGIISKWAVSVREFPASRYPAYLDGMGYVLTMTAVQALTKIFPSVRFFRFEDVYIGMCLERLGFRPKGNGGFLRGDIVLTLCSYKAMYVFALHGVCEQMMRAIWRSKCTGMQKPAIKIPADTRSKWIKHAVRANINQTVF